MSHRIGRQSSRSGPSVPRVLRAIGAASCLGALWAVAVAAGPLAGTSIFNVAGGSATLPGGTPYAVQSNAVLAVVSPLEAVRLQAPQSSVAVPGANARFVHRLTNLGNDMFEFRLDVINQPADAFDLAGFALTYDRNGNGVPDGADTPIAPGGTIALAAGATAQILLDALVPPASPNGARALVRLSATGIAQASSDANVDTLATPAAAAPPALAFYDGSDFARPTRFGGAGNPLFVQAVAPACDTRPAVADSIVVRLSSDQGNDDEAFLAVETGPNTGVFRVLPNVPTESGSSGSSGSSFGVKGDATLFAPPNDRVVATLDGCGAPRTETELWIDPAGVVFDATTDAPVSGARIALVDVTGAGNGGDAGGPARVFERDGVTAALPERTTGPDGRFAFALVPPSTYRFAVVPAPGHRFPSGAAPASLPAARAIDPSGSYGGAFAVTSVGALAPVRLDVPLDPEPTDALFVELATTRPVVELGDAFDYVARVANRSATALSGVVLDAVLPPGFAYLAGTARLDGAGLGDPMGGGGPALAFALGDLAAGQVVELRYRVRVGAGALDGDRVHAVQARAAGLTSNRASAKVEVTGGVFAEEAAILGTVFVDANRNHRYDTGDPGLAGVRLFLDDGTFAVTDATGRYSLYGISPRTHALKVDVTTLPARARLLALDARDADTPGLRFVDLQRNDVLRADFAVAGDTTLLRETEKRWIASQAAAAPEVAREAARGGDALESRSAPDARSLPASGSLTGESRLPLFPRALAGADERAVGGAAAATSDTARASASVAAASLEARLAAMSPRLGFVDLADGDTLAGDQAVVRVRGPIGAVFRLAVGGVDVVPSRVGRKLSAPGSGVELWEYVGVRFVPGVNRLEVSQVGVPAEVVAPIAIAVVVPDRPERLEIEAPAAVPADGFTPAPIEIRITDARGVPVATRTLVTLEATFGRLVADDQDLGLAGLQIAVEGGRAHVGLQPPGGPGAAEVRAHALGLEAGTRIQFVPDLRPLLAVGTLEGTLALRGGPGRGGAAGRGIAPLFEAPFTAFASSSRDGSALAAVRGALFMKGRLREDVLLTLGYDSDRSKDMRRLRDLQPNAFYPLYGDAAARGFEAQSSRSLYARLDRRGASVLYGDFVTPGGGGSRTLAAYSRSLNGVAARYEDARWRLNAFSSRDRARRQVDEVRGRGVSGPYALSITPLVEGTERVEIVVRDRNRPSVVLETTARQRFTEYEIDALRGEIVLRAPLPSLDADLNPVYVRVSYEVESGGAPFWVTGFEGRARVGERLEIGGSYVDDLDPAGANELRSAFAGTHLGDGSTIEGEIAFTNAPGRGRDEGGRVEWRQATSALEARAWASATGAHFSNPTSGFGPGRVEAGGRVSSVLSPRSRLIGEALYSATSGGDERRGGVTVALDRKLSERLRGEIGTRFSGGTNAVGVSDPFAATMRAKLTSRLPGRHESTAWLELEQDAVRFDRRRAAIGAETRVTPRGRLYGRHEFITSLAGPWALSSASREHLSVVGFDANVTPDARVFSEYRIDGAFAARDAEAAVGLRNVWRLSRGLRLNGSFERVQPMGEGAAPGGAGASTALAAALETSESERWKGSARAEYRTSKTSEGWLLTAAGALRLDERWSVLARNYFSLQDAAAGSDEMSERMQAGFAYRSGPDWDVLARYELHAERGAGSASGLLPASGTVPVPPPGRSRLAHVLSIHGAGPLNEHAQGALAWAGKLARETSQGVVTNVSAHWIHGRATWSLGRQLDAGLSTSVLMGSGSRRGGAGVEVGRRLERGVWLSLGANAMGYADDDLTGEEYTRRGVYLRLRARFDEGLFLGHRAPAPSDEARAEPNSTSDADGGER